MQAVAATRPSCSPSPPHRSFEVTAGKMPTTQISRSGSSQHQVKYADVQTVQPTITPADIVNRDLMILRQHSGFIPQQMRYVRDIPPKFCLDSAIGWKLKRELLRFTSTKSIHKQSGPRQARSPGRSEIRVESATFAELNLRAARKPADMLKHEPIEMLIRAIDIVDGTGHHPGRLGPS